MGGNPFLSILIMRGNPFLPTCPLKFYNSVLCWPFLPTCPLILFLIMGGEVFKRMEGNMRGHMIRWYDSADDSLVCTRWYVLHITTHRAYGSLVCTTRHIQVICLGGKVFKRMGGNMRGHMNGRKDEGAYEWFVGMIRWYDSLIWFVDMIRSYDSLIWFVHMIRWYDLFIWFVGMNRSYGSLIWFVGMIRWYDSLIWFGFVGMHYKSRHTGHMIRWYDSFIWFVDMICSYGSFIWFVHMIHSYDSFIWFVHMIRWNDSLIWFVDMIRWYDSFIWFGIGFVGMYYKSRHTTGHMIRYRIRW